MTAPSQDSSSTIRVYGARQHNLKNIDVVIPRGSFTVITGLSVPGNSSLAFDSIYAAGRRILILAAVLKRHGGNHLVVIEAADPEDSPRWK